MAMAVKKIIWSDRRVISVCLVLLLLAVTWCVKTYNSPGSVFWDMIDNNLSTRSITKHVVSDEAGTKSDQYTQISFGAQNFSHNVVTLTQNQGDTSTVIKTESIGTPSVDFSRYNSIETNRKNAAGQLPDFSKIRGIWGKNDTNTQYLSQAMFGVVPFANLNPAQRSKILKLMKDTKVYDTAFDKVTTQNGNYVYNVSLNPLPYIKLLKELSKVTGITVLADVNPDTYQNAPSVKLMFTVSKYSHQLKDIKYTDEQGLEESYESHGILSSIQIPGNTIPINELESRVVNVQ